jgi:aldose 1-epimerase
MMPLTLSQGDQQVRVRPELGGAIERYNWHGIELLRPAPPDGGVRQMGIFPLVPYANRIGNGQLPGHRALRPNFPPEPHSLHGFGWQRPWQASATTDHSALLTLDHAADADWPFDCTCSLAIVLDAVGLHLQLALTHTGSGSMPAGLGFHPFFPTASGPLLDARWDGRWETGADQLPLLQVAAVPATRMPVQNWEVDHCHTGWDGKASLQYARHSVALSADCAFLHCFKPADGRPFIALEPVSHQPNAHQLAPQQLHQLERGQQFSITMHIQAQERST